MLKICSKCKVEKETDYFCKDKNRKDGLYPQCKDCQAISRQRITKESRQRYNKKYCESEKGIKTRHAYAISDKKKQQDKAYASTPAGKEVRKRAQKTYFELHQDIAELRAIRTYITFVIKPEILKRDNYSCQLCHTDRNLICHHIIPVNIDPEQILNRSNLITLCEDCHSKAHNGSWHDINTEIASKLTSSLSPTFIKELYNGN
jgi:hypothetical protein